jgi:hypothetical protein
MAANTTPIFPLTPTIGIGSLNSATAVTTRVPITGTTGLTQLTPTSTNGQKIDAIQVKGQGTTVANQVGIWVYNGTTSYLYDEISVTAVTASTTVASFVSTTSYTNLVLPPTYQVYISQTVQSNVTVHALGGTY